MQIPVLVEPIANGFRARTGEPLGLSAEAPTAEEAVFQVRELLAAKLANGIGMVSLDVPEMVDKSPLPGAGIFSPDDPLVQEWIEIMAENRRLENEREAQELEAKQ
jgi:hypothetical protein